MKKSEIFKAAHQIARELRNTIGNYARALSIGLRQAWQQAKGGAKRTPAELVDFINKNFGAKAKLWEKSGYSRIYFEGFNTRKVKQTLYFCLNTNEFKAFTECQSQPLSWCISQNKIARENYASAIAWLESNAQ
jgi:hypothetical protein